MLKIPGWTVSLVFLVAGVPASQAAIALTAAEVEVTSEDAEPESVQEDSRNPEAASDVEATQDLGEAETRLNDNAEQDPHPMDSTGKVTKTATHNVNESEADTFVVKTGNNRLAVNPVSGNIELSEDYMGGFVDLIGAKEDGFGPDFISGVDRQGWVVVQAVKRPTAPRGLAIAGELLDFSVPVDHSLCSELSCLKKAIVMDRNDVLVFGESAKYASPSVNSYRTGSRSATPMAQYSSISESEFWILNVLSWLREAIRNPVIIGSTILLFAGLALVRGASRRQVSD